MSIFVCPEWGHELDQALWTLPKKNPHMVPTQKAPGPAQQHQKVLRSLVSVSFFFKLFFVCLFLTFTTLGNPLQKWAWLTERSSLKVLLTFWFCAAGVFSSTLQRSLRDWAPCLTWVVALSFFYCSKLKVDYSCMKAVTGTFGPRLDLVWLCWILSNLPDSVVLGHQRVLGRPSQTGEPEYWIL